MTTRTGPHREYLEGLDHLRHLVTEIENDLDADKREFYQCDDNDEEKYEKYVKHINDTLLSFNTKLRKNNMRLEVIDSEIKLVEFLNRIRTLDGDVDQRQIDDVTHFWDQIKMSVEGIQAAAMKYHTRVLRRLLSSCISYKNGLTNLELTTVYAAEVKNYVQIIKDTHRNVNELTKSFSNGIRQDLFTNNSFSQRILVMCDQKAFPILRIFPDASEKMGQILRLSRQWLDKDETYVHDITTHIREARKESRRREREFREQQEKQREVSRSAEDTHSIFKSNKRKLMKIQNDLKTLQARLQQGLQSRKHINDEKRQKEGMLDFFDISITQTKKNYALQLKKGRIAKQLKELEVSLLQIERELAEVERHVGEKEGERDRMSDLITESTASYSALKSNLDELSINVDRLQQELTEVTESLAQLEMIQTFKTSPEKVEDLFDKPTKVKLAPSLKEKIQRKRKLLSGSD